MNLNHWCDPNPDRNYFPSVIDPAGNRFTHNHVDHSNCSGEEIINYGTKRQEVVKCECPCHKPLSTHIGTINRSEEHR